ncbi:unnamed protein product [Calypogeia fissa]
MLNEREVLMVPPSQESCCIDRNVHLCGRVDSVKRVAFNNHPLQQGRPPRDDGFDLGFPGDAITGGGGGGGGQCPGEDKAEDEAEGNNCSDDRFLAPSSPPIAAAAAVAAAAASSSPTMHEEGHSGMMNSTGDFGSSRAPAQNGWSTKDNGLEAKENGFVGVSEKRMRNGERLASHPPDAGLGNQGGESFQEDCPEVPMRKRVHVSDDNTVDVLSKRGGEVGVSSGGRVESSEGNKSVSLGVVTPTKSDEGKPSEGKMSPDSEVKGGEEASARTEEVNGKGVFETEEAILSHSGEDVEMLSAEEEAREFRWESDARSASEPEESPVHVTDNFGDRRTPEEEFRDMDVDPVSVENIQPVGIEEVGGSASPRAVERDGVQLQEQPVLERDAEDHLRNRSGSPDLSLQPPPPDTLEARFQEEERNPGRNRPHQQVPRDVEVIEFDDSDDDDDADDDQAFGAAREAYDSDGSSTKGKKPISSQLGEQQRQRHRYRFTSSESTAPSYNADEDNSDSDDDLQVLGSRPPPNANGHGRNYGSANPVVVEDDDDDDNYSTTEEQDSDSSDVEEVGDSQSDIRRRWEEAAMRRRMGRAMQSAGSKANASQGGTVNLDDDGTESQGLEESVATSTYRGSPDSKDQTETSEARGGLDGVVHRAEGRGTTFRAAEGQRPVRAAPHVEDVMFNNFEAAKVKVPDTPADSGRPTVFSSPGSDQGDISGSKSVRGETPGITELVRVKTWSTAVQSENQQGEPSSRDSDQNGDERPHSKHVLLEGLENGTGENQALVAVEAEASIAHEDLLAAKERLKQTDHYRKTDAEEWALRQQEIERQAAESKRLRQRKRQEADRKREMERKQKERIEELRLSQRKEERQMDLRDQLRGQVRTELERVAANCLDFATLLRKLGVPVEGGSQPSTQQVNAAYKKALFKFHPDRAVASSQGEPRKQVEAEEKFKLIQRLKDTLTPVANDYTYPTYRSFF